MSLFDEELQERLKMPSIGDAKHIRDFQTFLAALYGPANKDRSVDYLYGYFSRSAAYLGKYLSQKKNADEYFYRLVSWACSISTYFAIDLQKSIFSRFPGACPYCLSSRCVCHRTNKQPVQRAASVVSSAFITAHEAQRELKFKFDVLERETHNWSFEAASKVLSKVYPNNEIIWHHAGPWHLIAKMQEEVGEVHEAISKYSAGLKPKSAIGEELADTLAWLLGAWHILNPGRTLDGALIDYYMAGCPVCTRNPCSCTDRADRAAELIDPEVLDKIYEAILQLEDNLPAGKSGLEDLRKSLEVARESQSEPTAIHTLREAQGKMAALRDSVETTDEIGKRSLSIINTVIALIEKIPWF